MAETVANVDTSALDEMVKDLDRFADVKTRRRIARFAVKGMAKPIQQEIRNVIGEVGAVSLGHLKKSIINKGVVGPKGNFAALAGAKSQTKSDPVRRRNPNPAKYYHIVDKGARPHFNVRGVRLRTVSGRVFGAALRIGGAGRHPGFPGREIKSQGERRGAPKAIASFMEAYKTKEKREWKKITG